MRLRERSAVEKNMNLLNFVNKKMPESDILEKRLLDVRIDSGSHCHNYQSEKNIGVELLRQVAKKSKTIASFKFSLGTNYKKH